MYAKEPADTLAAEMGWVFRLAGAAWRRVAPSPQPRQILEVAPISWLLERGAVVGSAVALVIFTFITAAHLRVRSEAGANLLMLVLAMVAAGAVFVTFVFTTLMHEPASIATLAGILVLSVTLDNGWKHFRAARTKNVQLAR